MEEGNKLLFLGRRYELGDVIDYLRDFTYGVTAVGLHFGMDETRLYRCSPRGDGEWEAKMLSPGGGYAVPNLICYENGRPVIGEAARNRPNVIDSFKTPPEFWYEPATSGRSYDEVIHDYIAGVWQLALRSDTELSESVASGSAVVVVGCPARAEWTGKDAMKRYAELVGRATGCKAVMLPEPNAALMSAVCGYDESPLDNDSGLCLRSGALILSEDGGHVEASLLLEGRAALVSEWRPGDAQSMDDFVLRAVERAAGEGAGAVVVTGRGWELEKAACKAIAGVKDGSAPVLADCDPVTAVAGGLCKAYTLIAKASVALDRAWGEKVEPLIRRHNEELLRETAEAACSHAMSAVYERLAPILGDGEPHRRSSLLEAGRETIENDAGLGGAVAAAFRESFERCAESCRGVMDGPLLSFDCNVYGGLFYDGLFDDKAFDGEILPGGSAPERPDTFYLNEHMRSTVGHSLSSNIFHSVFCTVITVLSGGATLLNDGLWHMKHMHDEEDEGFSAEMCAKILRRLEDPPVRSRRRAVKGLVKAFKDDDMLAGSFPAAMYGMFEKAMGCSLLLLGTDEDVTDEDGAAGYRG